MKIISHLLTVFLLATVCGCMTESSPSRIDAESLAGKWQMISRHGDQSRDLGTTITFDENGSWNSSSLPEYKNNQIISGGRFTIEANQVHLLSFKNRQEHKEVWDVLNQNQLHKKIPGANNEEKGDGQQKSGIFLERI